MTFAVTIFTSAFLLFGVQPLIAKAILPWYGGSGAVWSTSLLFFQLLLLAGYAYAHVVARRLSQRAGVVLHIAVLLAAVAALPILPETHWQPKGGESDPEFGILLLLAASVGLPYFAISITGPLLQAWFSRAHPTRSPYPLYALSNVASLLALLAFPVLERFADVPSLATAWGIGFALFALLCGAAGLSTWNVAVPASPADAGEREAEAPGALTRILWIALPACASALLLSLSNTLTQDVAVVPFLWVMPLAIYLLSFVFTFESDRLYPRAVFAVLMPIAIATVALFRYELGWNFDLLMQIGGYSGALFVLCMVCHGEVARLRPHPSRLTGFYLSLSTGGALGGLFVAVIAPRIFIDYYEIAASLVACALAVIAAWWASGALGRLRVPAPVSAAVLLAAVAAFGVYARGAELGVFPEAIQRARNFYGVLRLIDTDELRMLAHGRINHGFQSHKGHFRRVATTYFSPISGLGRVLVLPAQNRKVGVIGLGVGTIAAYGRAGDEYRFYELNPIIARWAQEYFTYLSDSAAKCLLIVGDGRISLQRESPQGFDVLVLDAFSGDSPPAHLLTVEAFAEYLRHMKSSGMIAVNISNQHLDLRPVVERVADYHGLPTVTFMNPADAGRGYFASRWVIVSANPGAQQDTSALPFVEEFGRQSDPGPLWTDAHTSLLPVLR